MKQRCEYSLKVRGEKSQLRDDREERLNALGFNWVAPCVRKKTFVTTTLEAAAVAAGEEGAGVDDGIVAGELHHDPVVDEVVEGITPTPVVGTHHHGGVLPQQTQPQQHTNHHPLVSTQADVALAMAGAVVVGGPSSQQAAAMWDQSQKATVI